MKVRIIFKPFPGIRAKAICTFKYRKGRVPMGFNIEDQSHSYKLFSFLDLEVSTLAKPKPYSWGFHGCPGALGALGHANVASVQLGLSGVLIQLPGAHA